MDAPLGRRRLLSRRLWLAIGASAVLGAAFGALVASLTGSSVEAVLAWSLGTGLGASGMVAIAALEQTADRRWIVKTLQWIIGIAGLGALGVVVATSSGWASFPSLISYSVKIAYVVAAIGVVLAMIAGLLAYGRLNEIRRQRLMSGGSLLSGMQGAMFALDFGLVRDILVERRASLRGHVRPTRGSGTGLKALILRDVQRVFRTPRPLVFLVAGVIVPYAISALGLATMNPMLSGLVLMAALIPFMNALRVLSRTKGLSRCFPFATGGLRTASMAVPAVLALLWAIAVLPAFMGIGSAATHASPGEASTNAIITGAAGLLAAVRWMTAQPANYSAPMVATGAGAMPPGLAFNVLRGFDIVAVITLPLVLGWSSWVSIIIAFIAYGVLRSGMNQEDMLAEREDQKRQLAEAKAKARGETTLAKEKIKVRRKR